MTAPPDGEDDRSTDPDDRRDERDEPVGPFNRAEEEQRRLDAFACDPEKDHESETERGAGIERGGALSDVFDVLDIPDWRAWAPAIDAA